jgi:hypothetical protein
MSLRGTLVSAFPPLGADGLGIASSSSSRSISRYMSVATFWRSTSNLSNATKDLEGDQVASVNITLTLIESPSKNALRSSWKACLLFCLRWAGRTSRSRSESRPCEGTSVRRDPGGIGASRFLLNIMEL